ncbi:MAG: ribosome small subunit-dependent GTPase A [Eubacterium sp.]|nr:ribosome small subunit-dependent GTPase A [Eubacterium sp.]
MDSGKIIRGVGGFYYVVTADAAVYECRAKGIFRKDDIRPLPGDNVIFSILDEEKRIGNIDEIIERKNELIRPPVANVDQALVVVSIKKPGLNRGLLDRFLLMMEVLDIPSFVCLTKTDLASEDEISELIRAYEPCTSQVFPVNNINGSGIKAVRKALQGRTTVLAGASGVGKSSLVSHICPGVSLEIGNVSKKTQRGRHTTRHSELFFIDGETFIFDTPGFSSFSLPELLPEELGAYFREFEPYVGECAFNMCTHIHEPGCAVREHIGVSIDEKRYESYVKMFDELNRIAVRAGRSKR